MTNQTTINNLRDLFNAMRNTPRTDDGEMDNTAWIAAGLPMAHGERDWTSLPSFGGSEPRNTVGVWSWDETHMIVGSCAEDLEIVTR